MVSKKSLENLCDKLFETHHPYCCLTLDEKDNAPILLLHDGRGHILQSARWRDGSFWVVDEEEK